MTEAELQLRGKKEEAVGHFSYLQHLYLVFQIFQMLNKHQVIYCIRVDSLSAAKVLICG